jgi:hypothetical protein
MTKSSQIQLVDATVPVIPERVVVAMAEITESMQEGLLVLAVGADLQVMQSVDGVPQRRDLRHDRFRATTE